MKALVLSMLAIASIAAMTSCSSENDPIDEVKTDGEKVEIKLTAAVAEIVSKAPIEGSNTPSFEAFVVRMDGADQNTALSKLDQATAITANVDNGNITFTPAQYFLNTGNVYFIGYSKGGQSEPNLSQGKVSYTITGDEDIMYAQITDAGSKNQSTSTALNYQHKLTKLEIKVIAENQSVADLWGDVESIAINTPTNLELDLSNGNLSKTASAVENSLNTINKSVSSIPTTIDTNNGGYLMILPSNTAPVISIKTANMATAQDITITGLTKTEESKKHIITLTFNGTNITSKTATVGNWETGTEGNGSIN